MRVLLVSSSSGSRGGGELYLVGLAQGLRELGHEVSLWMSEHQSMDELAAKAAPWADVIRSPYVNTYLRGTRVLGAVLDRATRRRIAREFRNIEPEIIHINKQNLEDGLDLLHAARDTGLPAVATVHITRTMRALGARWASLRDRLAMGMLQRWGAPCITAHRFYKGIDGDVRGLEGAPHFYCVPNGVADARLMADRDAVRRQWGLDQQQIVLGIAARIEHQKNPLFLLDVLPELPPHVHLVWVGDGRLRGPMEAAVKEKGLTNRVHLDGWREDAPRRLSGMDIFVLPSLYEGWPFVVLEAMSAALPIVASRVDGLNESLQDGQTGYLIELNDRQAWIRRLAELVASPATARRLGSAARAQYEAHFSLDAMARATVEVYRQAGALSPQTTLAASAH